MSTFCVPDAVCRSCLFKTTSHSLSRTGFGASVPKSKRPSSRDSSFRGVSCDITHSSDEMNDRASAPPRGLDGGDVDLLHRHHRLERTLCLVASCCHGVREHARRYLP